MKLHKFKSYEEYKRVQVLTNKRKLDKVWVLEEAIKTISDKLQEKRDNLKFGLCHGTRRGKEQGWFRDNLDVEVIGTEIAPTAIQFPHTIEWDFHDVKPEWENSVSFIYSNSLDHSFNPTMCLDQWMSCLEPDGYCILHWSKGHRGGGSTKVSDPFGASLGEYVDLVMKKFVLEDVTNLGRTYVLWIQNLSD